MFAGHKMSGIQIKFILKEWDRKKSNLIIFLVAVKANKCLRSKTNLFQQRNENKKKWAGIDYKNHLYSAGQ